MKADARSFVWKWFGSLNDATTGKRVHADKVFCSQCFDSNRLKGYKETVSTTNLAQHMREAHGILFMIIFPRTFCLSTFLIVINFATLRSISDKILCRLATDEVMFLPVLAYCSIPWRR